MCKSKSQNCSFFVSETPLHITIKNRKVKKCKWLYKKSDKKNNCSPVTTGSGHRKPLQKTGRNWSVNLPEN